LRGDFVWAEARAWGEGHEWRDYTSEESPPGSVRSSDPEIVANGLVKRWERFPVRPDLCFGTEGSEVRILSPRRNFNVGGFAPAHPLHTH
jgi:hypothetical protein